MAASGHDTEEALASPSLPCLAPPPGGRDSTLPWSDLASSSGVGDIVAEVEAGAFAAWAEAGGIAAEAEAGGTVAEVEADPPENAAAVAEVGIENSGTLRPRRTGLSFASLPYEEDCALPPGKAELSSSR